jgi:uncharacterized membrane protein
MTTDKKEILNENSAKKNISFEGIIGVILGVLIMASFIFVLYISSLSTRKNLTTEKESKTTSIVEPKPYENLAKQRVEYIPNMNAFSEWLDNNKNRRIVSITVLTQFTLIVVSEPFGTTLKE